ncbi:MAG: hypothetical protein IKP33_01790 [Prevotella sp.]|nr:hypothetical protein [Prevotella sp.]
MENSNLGNVQKKGQVVSDATPRKILVEPLAGEGFYKRIVNELGDALMYICSDYSMDDIEIRDKVLHTIAESREYFMEFLKTLSELKDANETPKTTNSG